MIQEESQMLQFFLMPFELEDLPYVINEGIIFVDKFQLRNALAAAFPTTTNYSNVHFNRFLKTHGCDIYEGYVDLASCVNAVSVWRSLEDIKSQLYHLELKNALDLLLSKPSSVNHQHTTSSQSSSSSSQSNSETSSQSNSETSCKFR